MYLWNIHNETDWLARQVRNVDNSHLSYEHTRWLKKREKALYDIFNDEATGKKHIWNISDCVTGIQSVNNSAMTFRSKAFMSRCCVKRKRNTLTQPESKIPPANLCFFFLFLNKVTRFDSTMPSKTNLFLIMI